VQQVRDADDN